MFEFFIDGEIVKFIHVLQEPKIVMQASGFLGVFHYFAEVQKLQINDMHVDVLAFVFL